MEIRRLLQVYNKSAKYLSVNYPTKVNLEGLPFAQKYTIACDFKLFKKFDKSVTEMKQKNVNILRWDYKSVGLSEVK